MGTEKNLDSKSTKGGLAICLTITGGICLIVLGLKSNPKLLATVGRIFQELREISKNPSREPADVNHEPEFNLSNAGDDLMGFGKFDDKSEKELSNLEEPKTPEEIAEKRSPIAEISVPKVVSQRHQENKTVKS